VISTFGGSAAVRTVRTEPSGTDTQFLVDETVAMLFPPTQERDEPLFSYRFVEKNIAVRERALIPPSGGEA